MPLTKEDGDIITRAILVAFGKWTAICFMVGILVGLLYAIMNNSGGGQ